MFSFFQTVMIKHCNAITTKNEFSLYRKSRENKDEKNWIGKTQNTFHPTCSCDFGKGPRELHCRIIFYIAETTTELACSMLTFRSNYDYSTSELFQNLKRPKLIAHQCVVS